MQPDDTIGDALATDTPAAQALLETLRNGPNGGLAEVFPELGALVTTPEEYLAVEHERGRKPLLDHLSVRVLGRKLRGLELGDRAVFQRDDALSAAAFAEEAAILAGVAGAGLLPCVRAALVFCDFTKGGSIAQRRRWSRDLGVDLSVHNLASARVLEVEGTLGRIPHLRARPALAALVIALVESHGLAGQHVRGETPLPLMAPFVRYLRYGARDLEVADPVGRAVDCLHLVNLCDTAGVREGLMTDELRAQLLGVERQLRELGGAGGPVELAAIERELAGHEDALWRAAHPQADEHRLVRARLQDRLVRLRQGRIRAGEPAAAAGEVIAGLPDDVAGELGRLLGTAQLWYCEVATAGLRPDAQLAVLALALRAADEDPRIDVARPYHVTFQPLIPHLHDDGDPRTRYRRRLVETELAPVTLEELLSGAGARAGLIRDRDAAAPAVLAGFTTDIGGTTAVAVGFAENEEAGALLTLLSIYERKSSAAFHQTLKALCDLYGLRKDRFDRVANEHSYLVTMNAARSDKARMLDFARPGRIVEVGPGGGVVLDLLAEQFPDSEVIGVDISRLVVETLEARKQREGRGWTILEADAFDLPRVVGDAGCDTVVFCSVLHEIYSYVPWPTRFRLESVRDLLRAAWRTLRPGGRILIRDGVTPACGTRRIGFLAADARPFFDLFARQFEGRAIQFTDLDGGRVELSTADAMEFLYTYTWGPESFPYEIREQYGVLPYREYLQNIALWLGGEHPVRFLELPPDLRSYLQPGYQQALAGKVELTDEHDHPVPLPDSNCVIIIEKG